MSCEKIMCKYKLHERSSVIDWLKKNHPDKGGSLDSDEFNKVLECYKNKFTCKAKIKSNNAKDTKNTNDDKNAKNAKNAKNLYMHA